MSNKAVAGYSEINAETSVAISSPGNLILLVYDKLLGHLLAVESQLLTGEMPGESFNKAMDIFKMGLIPALDFEQGGEVAQNLSRLYDWSVRHLLKAKLNKDPRMVREVYDVLMPVYEAWQGIVTLETPA